MLYFNNQNQNQNHNPTVALMVAETLEWRDTSREEVFDRLLAMRGEEEFPQLLQKGAGEIPNLREFLEERPCNHWNVEAFQWWGELFSLLGEEVQMK